MRLAISDEAQSILPDTREDMSRESSNRVSRLRMPGNKCDVSVSRSSNTERQTEHKLSSSNKRAASRS